MYVDLQKQGKAEIGCAYWKLALSYEVYRICYKVIWQRFVCCLSLF